MRVLLTCDWHLKYALRQATGLRAAGAEVTLLIRDHAEEFDGSRAERDAALAETHAAGVRTLVMPGRMSDPSQLPALLALRRRIVAMRPDVAHAHEDADPRALPLLAGLPTVLTLHDPTRHPGQTEIDAHKRWFLEGGRERWFGRAGVIVIHSEHLRPEVRTGPGQTVAVVPHGINIADAPLPVPAEPAVGFFGRMEPYKGLDVLAAAMPRVWRERPDARIRLAGQGQTEFRLSDPRVDLRRGYLAESALPEFLGACTFLALPYTQASQSGAGSRAVGYGVPVLASRLGGLPDLALDRSWTVPPGDPDALAAAIVRGLDAGSEVRAAVRERVAEPRSWASAGERTLEVYRALFARRRPVPAAA